MGLVEFVTVKAPKSRRVTLTISPVQKIGQSKSTVWMTPMGYCTSRRGSVKYEMIVRRCWHQAPCRLCAESFEF
jgi:hypothetical protein